MFNSFEYLYFYTHIKCVFVYLYATQDEKNQVLTTYVWYRQVRQGYEKIYTLLHLHY